MLSVSCHILKICFYNSLVKPIQCGFDYFINTKDNLKLSFVWYNGRLLPLLFVLHSRWSKIITPIMITMTIQLKEFFSWIYDDVCLRKKNEIAIYMCIYIVKLENH